jgi:sulfonate transport system ATP-binding protein
MANISPGSTLKLFDLSKRFGSIAVLRTLNLEVAAGEFIAIVGRSGCGKSTLLRLVAGLEQPTQGGILLNNYPLRHIDPYTKMMFQDARLLPWKRVQDNVRIGLRGDWRPSVNLALQQVGLANRAMDWVSILSGGQRQRVALARALVSQPRLLLLDEPLGALDALTRIEMQQLIEQLWQQQQFTALLVTHDIEEAVTLAERVILIEAGHLVMDWSIPLPRPRRRGDPAFAAVVENILQRVLHNPESQISSLKPVGSG